MKMRWTWVALSLGGVAMVALAYPGLSDVIRQIGTIAFHSDRHVNWGGLLYVSAFICMPMGAVGLLLDQLDTKEKGPAPSAAPTIKFRWSWLMLALGGSYLLLAFFPDIYEAAMEGWTPNGWLTCGGDAPRSECGFDWWRLAKTVSVVSIPMGVVGILLDVAAWRAKRHIHRRHLQKQ